MANLLEKLIAAHCSPALAGIKPANLAACRKSDFAAEGSDIHKEISQLEDKLKSKNIRIDIVCECDRRVLVMVYRKDVLDNHLKNNLNKAFLAQYGYAGAAQTDEYIEILKTRIRDDDFPHEIGVFLGYPLHDIYCFINHRDQGCLMTGEWKVYHNIDEAKRLFDRFKKCKTAVTQKLSEGKTLAQIFCAA